MVESSRLDTGPLSWDEARHALRELLHTHLEDNRSSSQYNHNKRGGDHPDTIPLRSGRESLLSRIILHDLDLYIGTLSLSIILLILISLSLHGGRLGNDNDANWILNPKVTIPLLYSELIGATILVIASFINTWIIRRRRFLNKNDKENAKRREIQKFLRSSGMTNHDLRSETVAAYSTSNDSLNNDESNVSVPCQLNSQTEVFPVFRKQGGLASWSTIPNLLLVKGDWIALQVGDIAPARCTTISTNDTTTIEGWTFAAGERITMESLKCTTDSVTSNLPIGRTTLHPQTSVDHFLTLCNNMQIFVLVDSPILSSLNRIAGAPPSSQVSQQVKAVREVLAVFAFIILLLTAIILFSRQQITSNDITTAISLPILAALGALPLVGPAYIFGLEVLGTARILTAVHPYSSTTTMQNNERESLSTWLLWRYIVATSVSRLSLWSVIDSLYRCWNRSNVERSATRRIKLIRIPPASIHLLEKLGVATAFALVDDELACEPQSIPQQLLMPSAKGLKLLDLCPVHEGEEHDDESETGETSALQRQRGKSFDSDSESDDETISRQMSVRRKGLQKRLGRYKKRVVQQDASVDESSGQDVSRYDVQFEESDWWHFLPSLKCIGLACLLHDEGSSTCDLNDVTVDQYEHKSIDSKTVYQCSNSARRELASIVRRERQSKQLVSLAECIGFTNEDNSTGKRGDISAFTERLRLHVLSTQLFKERLLLDGHERSSEQSRWWGLLRPDMTSVVVHDSRTNAFQLLTVGDPITVCNLCNEAWQGEISTILPFPTSDKRTIIETTNAWKLADLDVTAFSYSPVPHTLEAVLSQNQGTKQYLLDHTENATPFGKDKGIVSEWSFLGNQIFLGVLGSLVIPRQEIRKLLDVLGDAGVRFVYFSPRNMRRQKALAMQLGIDVAWNCAISLRPLESGEDDPHRMVSNYADWDVNAKLPHGVRDVRKHLQEVDNVPLLVSLFTDATKDTTKEMVKIFHEYDDTVIAVGLSHLTRNEDIFASADISVGIDILEETIEGQNKLKSLSNVTKSELEFLQSMSSQSCAFRLRGASSVAHISTIIEKSRASLDASVSSAMFLIFGCMSYSLYVLFSVCTPATSIPYVPTIGSALYLLVMLPIVGLCMQLTDGDTNNMKRVPMKNDKTILFSRKDRLSFLAMALTKAVLPALLPQILHLISFGELVLKFDNDFVTTHCPVATNWVDIVRCDGMKHYVGEAKSTAGSLVLAQFMLCVIMSSAAFVYRFRPLREQIPWERNSLWIVSILFAIGILVMYITVSTKTGTAAVLPWYFYIISMTTPFVCISWVEFFKRSETKQEERAEKVRRLQFETRLGAWSPK